MAEIKTAEKVFLEVKKYWVDLICKLAKRLKDEPKLSQIEKKEIARKIIFGCKDLTVDGIEFTCINDTIEGNDQLCVEGTILDVKQASLIRPYYKTVATCAKVLNCIYGGNSTEYKQESWDKYCSGEMTEENAVNILNQTLDTVFNDKGILDQAIELAKQGEWKLATD